MKKPSLSIIVMLVLFSLTSFALAKDRDVLVSTDFNYVLQSNGTAQITNYNGIAQELVIPLELDGYTVTSIGENAFSECKSLTSVTLPDSITSIGEYAFSDCTNLTSIIIPNGVTSIGECAFFTCTSLTDVYIPDSVTRIDTNPFVQCHSLVNIHVSPDHPFLATIDGVLFSKPERRLICYPCAFVQTEYTVPQGIQIIGNGAFAICHDLKTVNIPNSVTEIGIVAFAWCDGLTAVTIPDSVTSIGISAFYNCTNLSSVTVPSSVRFIGNDAFSYCADSLMLTVGRNSYALQYCRDNALNYNYIDANDWLNG